MSSIAAVIAPLVSPRIFVQPEFVRVDYLLSEIGHDKRDVSARGNHRMPTIGITLPRYSGMRVNVGDNSKTGFSTELPEWSKPKRLEDDHARVETVWIEIIVVDEARDASPRIRATSSSRAE